MYKEYKANRDTLCLATKQGELKKYWEQKVYQLPKHEHTYEFASNKSISHLPATYRVSNYEAINKHCCYILSNITNFFKYAGL